MRLMIHTYDIRPSGHTLKVWGWTFTCKNAGKHKEQVIQFLKSLNLNPEGGFRVHVKEDNKTLLNVRMNGETKKAVLQFLRQLETSCPEMMKRNNLLDFT